MVLPHAHLYDTSDNTALLPLQTPHNAVSGTAWRSLWQRCAHSSAASFSKSSFCSSAPKFTLLSSRNLRNSDDSATNILTSATPSHAAGGLCADAVVKSPDGLSSSSEPEEHSRYSYSPARWSEPGHVLSGVAKEVVRVKAVHSDVQARRRETGLVPGVFVGSMYIVHPLTCPEAQAHWPENSSDGIREEDPRLLLCATRDSAVFQAKKIMRLRFDAASQPQSSGNGSRGISLSSFRDEGAAILKSATARQGLHSMIASPPQLMDCEGGDIADSSLLSTSSEQPTHPAAPVIASSSSGSIADAQDARGAWLSTATPVSLPQNVASASQTTEGSSFAARLAAGDKLAVDHLFSMYDRNARSITFLSHPSTLAMRLRLAAMQLCQDASNARDTQGLRVAQPIIRLLHATIERYRRETVAHVEALRRLAPAHLHAAWPSARDIDSGSQVSNTGGQKDSVGGSVQPQVYATSMTSALECMSRAPASFLIARDASEVLELQRVHLEEGRRALTALKRVRTRLRRQRKQGQSLKEQLAESRRRRTGAAAANALDVDDVALPPRLSAMTARFCQSAEAEIKHSTADDTAAAYLRLVHNKTRGLPAFSVPGLYFSVGTKEGEVRLMPMFLSRRTLDAAVKEARSVGAVSSHQARRLRRFMSRKGAENRSAAVFADSLAKVGISVGGGVGSSGGKQRDEDDVPEAEDLLTEMGHNKALSGGGSGGITLGLGEALVGAAATMALGTASLLAATWQAAGDRADDVLYSSGVGGRLPPLQLPVNVQAHLLQDYVTDCGRWNSRRRRNRTPLGGGASGGEGESVEGTIASAVAAVLHAAQELSSDEAKALLRLTFGKVNDASMKMNDGAMYTPGFVEAAAATPVYPPATAPVGDGSEDHAYLNFALNNAEVFGLSKPGGAWDDVEQPDHLKAVILVGDCSQHNTSGGGVHSRPPPVGVGDAAFFAAEGRITTDAPI